MSADLPDAGEDAVSLGLELLDDAVATGPDSESILPEMDERDFGSDGPDVNRPALVALHTKQQEVLDEFVREGVADRPALLGWLLRLQYRTLGRLPDLWYHRLATNRAALAVVTDGTVGNQQITAAEAKRERRRLVAKYLRPACRDGFRELRTSATEYLDDQAPDPEKMAALAMRPALDEHYARQTDALTALLDGFDDVDGLQSWLHDLDRDTFGAIKTVEQEFDFQLLHSRTARRACLGEQARYQTARERIAARFFLPATNVSVRVVAEKAGEIDHRTPEESGGVDV